MKKKTIPQLEERRRELLNRLVRTANELRDIDTTIRKIKTGKLRQPSPPGVKHTIAGEGYTKTRDWTADEFGDLVPTFGGTPAVE